MDPDFYSMFDRQREPGTWFGCHAPVIDDLILHGFQNRGLTKIPF